MILKGDELLLTFETPCWMCAVPEVPRFDYKLIRVPPEILPALEARLKVERHLVVAWLQAVCATFPGRGLVNLLREEPKLFPSFLRQLERENPIQVRPADLPCGALS
jgi:hypothetical protein